MVGRGLEQELLRQLFERVTTERSCHLVNVLGSAGVGKSRLVEEFVAGLGERATILRAHCPAFGDSVTLRPMVEIVRQAAAITPADSAASARARLAELLGGEDRGELLTERIAQLLGFGSEAGLPEDTFWALQRLLETMARHRPVVLVIDDLIGPTRSCWTRSSTWSSTRATSPSCCCAWLVPTSCSRGAGTGPAAR
jgi:predicted ATPase